ncbi:MAG: hypothetical protein ACR2QK_07830, partial [Acidimicrobiales bacterium]
MVRGLGVCFVALVILWWVALPVAGPPSWELDFEPGLADPTHADSTHADSRPADLMPADPGRAES